MFEQLFRDKFVWTATGTKRTLAYS